MNSKIYFFLSLCLYILVYGYLFIDIVRNILVYFYTYISYILIYLLLRAKQLSPHQTPNPIDQQSKHQHRNNRRQAALKPIIGP